ncbi:hypothetical protein B9J78_00480 [bacterium Unc6]|nr:hypothetical protein [bacterium Unc6]
MTNHLNMDLLMRQKRVLFLTTSTGSGHMRAGEAIRETLCGISSELKSKGEISASLIAVITDFDAHPYWFSKYVDEFIIPTEEMKEEFISYGIEANRIHAFGIPIHPGFSKTQNKLALKTKLGMRKDLPTILVMGGGWGLGPIEKIVQHLNGSKMALQLIIVAGKNEALYDKLKKISPEPNISIKNFGYVNNIDELMEISDIAITKPGGLVASELLTKGLPAVLIDVIDGQERANGNYLISKGVACRIKK